MRVVRSTGAGAIQAYDGRGLVRYARAGRCRLILLHGVGDFVPDGAALIEVYGEDPGEDADGKLRGMIALGDERTIEQDPAFAIRIMVDIANRALSPAVNDPTTAVQVLNHLGDTLRLVGSTPLPLPSASRAASARGARARPALGGLPVAGGDRDPRVRRTLPCRSCAAFAPCWRSSVSPCCRSAALRSTKSLHGWRRRSAGASAGRSISISPASPTRRESEASAVAGAR